MPEPHPGTAHAAGPSQGPRLRWGGRFAPHVLVPPIAMMLSVPLMRGAIVSGIFWWHGPTYAERTFVMDEFHPNDGSPYISGHLDGEIETRGLLGVIDNGRQLVAAAPTVVFERGATLPVWHSASAPLITVFGREVNDVPVATLPVRPGVASLAVYLLGLAMVAYAAMKLTAWVFRRRTREYGESVRGYGLRF